jgi:hypothetical protein
MSTNFMILGTTNQKLWVFEVFRRSLGKAGMCWSQLARVDHLRKKWKVGRKKNLKRNGDNPIGPGVDPRPDEASM